MKAGAGRTSAPELLMHFFRGLLVTLSLPTIAVAQSVDQVSRDELAGIKMVLAQAQEQSISKNREICGLFGRNAEGKLVSTRGRVGGRDGCRPGYDPRGVEVFATWHTHGAFEEDYDSEVPSPYDVEAEMEEGQIGFVATPGGRLWMIDGESGVADLVCGPSCLPADPNFESGVFGPIAKRYSLEQLLARENH